MVTLFLPQEMLIRVFLGWLRGEPLHCKMVAIPTLEEEDAGGNVAFMPPNGRVWPKPERRELVAVPGVDAERAKSIVSHHDLEHYAPVD